MKRSAMGTILGFFAVLALGWSAGRAAGEPPKAKAPTGQKVALKLNLKQGDKSTIKMMADQKMQVAGQDITNLLGIGWDQEVQSLDAQGNATVKITFVAVRFKMSAGPMQVDYDSEKGGEAPPMAAFLAPMVGQGFTFKISPTGKVSDVQGADQMLEKMAEKMPPGANKEQLKQQFGEQMVGNMYDFYPDQPVDNGDSWERTQKMASSIGAETKTKYTVLDHDDNVTLGIDGTVEGKEGGQMKLSGKQTGTMILNAKNGLPVKANIVQELKGEVQNMPVTMNGTITIESK